MQFVQLKRRDFITLLGGAAAAWPVSAHAQQPTMPMVGFLHVASPGAFPHLLAGFRQGLKDAGVIEGQDATIEFRWAEGHYDRLPELADELVRQRVSVLVAVGGEDSALAAKAATTTIPIVFLVARDPALTGLVVSLSRPGGNATGVNLYGAELGAKRLGLLHDLVPTASVIGLLLNPGYLTAEAEVKEVDATARRIGCEILLLKASNDSEIDAAFAAMRTRIGALLVGTDPFFNSRRRHIVTLAARESVPVMFDQREFAAAGGLISYGTSLADAYRQVGIYAARILRGEKPSELPVLQPTKFELVINLQTARTLGLTVPPTLLARADEVIE
jgi:putative tryptophan/tyrosine transport system substrate-binding protein